MFAFVKFFAGFILCLLVFSIVSSLLSNIINFGKFQITGYYSAFYIFFMASPSTFGYYCIQFILQYKKQEWNSRPIFILAYMGLAVLYNFVFGFVIPIIGLVGTRNHSIEQFIGLVVASGVTYLVLRGSFDEK